MCVWLRGLVASLLDPQTNDLAMPCSCLQIGNAFKGPCATIVFFRWWCSFTSRTGIKDLIAEESLHWAFFSKDRSLSLFATRLWESLNLPFNNKRLESCFHLIFCAVRDGHYDKQLSLLDSLHRASREVLSCSK